MKRLFIATTTISIAASTSSTTSSSTSPPLPDSSTGIQGPTGIVGLSNIQASTGSLTGITGITGTSGSATAATGPHFAVYPTGATGTAAAATGPIEAQHLYDDYTKTTAEYRQKVADLQPKGSFAMQPMKYNDTIDDDVSEHRRRSRYVSYYILPKLQHMMNVPMKNELDRTRAVLYDCREDLQTLQHLKSIRENELTQSQLILSQSNNQLSNVSNQVTSILKTRNKTSTSHLYGQQSATSATSAASTSTSTSSLKNVRFINKRTALKYEQAHAVRASLRNWSKQKEPQSMTSTLIELSQNHPLILQDMTHSLLRDHSKSNINGLQPYNEKATISFLEKSEKTFNNLLLNKPNEDCFAIATCAKRADLRATRTSNEIHVHVQKYLNTLAQARVTHRTAQCHAFYKHENDTLKRIEKLQHVINVWNETKATIVVNKPPLMNLMTTLPIPPTPTPIQKTSMPNIPVVFPPLPMLPKENKCLRICSNQGRCAWSKEKPKTENIYDGQELHSSKEISFPKEDPIQMIAVCICHDGYEGEDCGVKQCPNSCTKHGHCLDGECMCDTGYYGLSCGVQENENSPHIIRNKNVEQSLDVGLAYLHSATGGGGDRVGASGGATGTAALAASTASTASTTIDATGIDQTIGNDGDRAKIMQERLTQSNTSSIEAEHARKRSQKIMMMAEYMRLESSKNNKLEEEMQKLQDKGVVDKDALIMQRVRARQVEEAKKQKVQSILNIQEEKKKVLSRKQWSNKEYLTEKRQQINVQIEKQNINVLKHARALDEHSVQKGTILGNHILSLVSDMCIRNSWNDFISPKLKPRNAQGKVSKEVQRAYQQLNNVTHNNNDDDDSNNDDDDTNIIKNRMSNLKKSMKFTLQKNERKTKNLYDQATAEEMIRLKTDNSNTAPIQLMPPAIPKPASDLFDLMVNVPAPTAALSTAERQKMIVITQPSRLRNETKDINEISKYLKLAFRLVQKAELNQQNGNSVEDLKLMLSTPIPAPPTVHALEATTTKQKPIPSLATPYLITNDRDKDDLIQIKKNEAKEMLSTASNVMRALEQKIKTRTNKHQEVVQGLEASIRTSMASIDASNASWESMEREIHHGRKRHLKRQEEFRKRLSNAANDATREQIIGIYKLTNGKAPTPHNICNARHQQPMKPMAPPESYTQSHWIHTDALSGYHKCDVTETFDNTTGKKRQQFPKGDECWSARYTMQKGMEAPNVYFKASFDVPQLMYQDGNLLRASNVKVTSFPLIPIMTSVHHEAQCLDASIGQLGNQGTISMCSFGATVGLLPSTYVFDDKKQYDITDAFMKYGIFQATMLEDMPPTNTITLQGEEFCITPITAPNETDACMKCPTMRTMSKGSMKFALLGQLNSDMTDFLTMLPNGRPKYFRHVMIMDLTHGYNSNIYFNDNPSFDIEYAVTTMLDIDSLTIVDDTLEPNGNLTFSFEREFNINNRVTARLAAITLGKKIYIYMYVCICIELYAVMFAFFFFFSKKI